MNRLSKNFHVFEEETRAERLVAYRRTQSGSPVPTTGVSSSMLKRKRSKPKIAPALLPSSETDDDSQGISFPVDYQHEQYVTILEQQVTFKPPALSVRSTNRPLRLVVPTSPRTVDGMFPASFVLHNTKSCGSRAGQ